MRYIQSNASAKAPAKEKKATPKPAAGKYTAKDLQAKGVKKGVWERHDD